MAQSAPHIYLSALPFAPSSSRIAEQYSPRFQHTLKIEHGKSTKWPPLVTTIVPGSSLVICVAWWDNEYVAAGLENGNVFIWNVSTRAMISGPLSAGGEGGVLVSSVAFSRDGAYLASGLSDGRIQIWHVTTGEKAREALKDDEVHTGAITALSFSEDGEWLISGSIDCLVRIWDWGKVKVVAGPFGGHKNPVWMVSLTPDQKHVVSRSGFRTLQVWDIRTKQKVMTPSWNVPTGIISANVHRIIPSDTFYKSPFKSGFAPCSWSSATECEEEEYTSQTFEDFETSWNVLMSSGHCATPPDITSQSWNTFRSGMPYIEGQFKDSWILGASFSQDGEFVVTSSEDQTCVWYANSGKLVAGPFDYNGAICLAFSADGRRVVSGSWGGDLCVWNVVDGGGGPSDAADNPPQSVAFAGSKKIVVGYRNFGRTGVLDLLTGQETAKFFAEGLLGAVSLNGGDLIASTSDDAMCIFTQTGNLVTEVRSSCQQGRNSVIAFSPISNNIVAFGTEGGVVNVVNASNGARIAGPEQICHDRFTSLALSSSRQMRVAVASYHEMFVWDTCSGKIIGPLAHHCVRALVFSADARHITSVASDYTLCVWDSTTGEIVRGPVGLNDDQAVYVGKSSPFIALTQDAQKVAFLGDHHRILVFEVVYIGNGEIALCGPLVLGGHTSYITSMEFSRDGLLLATTSSNDFTVRIWDMQAAAEHEQAVIDSSVADVCELPNLNEAFIDDDGWVTCPSRRGGPPLRLTWIPETHRGFLYLPISVCKVVRCGQRGTGLDLGEFVHGKDWAMCKT